MFVFGFCLLLLLLLYRPPTLYVLWSIRLSVHSQKWLWHLLKHPVECSGLKGYPMLWPKTTRFFFFSLSFPSKTPLWHCALACWHSDQSLNIFKLPPMKDTPPPSRHHPCSHIHTYSRHDKLANILVYTPHTEMQNTQIHKIQKWASMKPQSLQYCTFNESSIIYEPKDKIAEGNPLAVNSYLWHENNHGASHRWKIANNDSKWDKTETILLSISPHKCSKGPNIMFYVLLSKCIKYKGDFAKVVESLFVKKKTKKL